MAIAAHKTPADIPHGTVRADVAIVGSGAGGAAAAAELASSGMRVLVVEEGAAWPKARFRPSNTWAARHLYVAGGAQFTRGNPTMPLAQGRAMGGSTVINSAICYHAPEHILRSWSGGLGLDLFDPDEMDVAYELVEKAIGVSRVTEALAGRNNLVVKRGTEALGLRGEFIPRNAPGCEGKGICQLGCPVGGKGSVDRNFLPQAVARGAEIWTGAKVLTIRTARGRVTGLDVAVTDPVSGAAGRRVHVEADCVVLAAGAVATPVILMASGLGAASGQLGRHLHVHPCTGTVALFDEDIHGWDGVFQGYCVTDLRAESILIQTYFATADVFYAQVPGLGEDGQRFLERIGNLASCGVLVGEQESEGRVRRRGDGAPDISYHLADSDRVKLLRGLRTICEIYEAAGSREIYPGVAGTRPVATAREAARLIPDTVPTQRLFLYASHPMGTARMGRDRRHSVVNPDGEVWGIEGLVVTDSSIFPGSLAVNPQMTVMASAIRIAARLAERAGERGGARGMGNGANGEGRTARAGAADAARAANASRATGAPENAASGGAERAKEAAC